METLLSDSRNLCSGGFLLGEEEAEQSNTETSREKEKNSSSPTNCRRKPTTRRAGKKDTFQKEIEKWEEFYDDMKTYLTDGSLNPRNRASVLKQADAFFLNSDGQLFFTKTFRDSSLSLNLPVVRSYEERMQVCKRIHLSTGEECIHHRRDTMLELLGQQFYWKGQRRDVCQCIASCEMCSIGLGGKRRAKPPGQKRDIRPVSKLPRLQPSPPLPHSSRTTYTPPPLPLLSPSPSSTHPDTPSNDSSTKAQGAEFGKSSSSNSTSSLKSPPLHHTPPPPLSTVSSSPASNSNSNSNSSPAFTQPTEISPTQTLTTSSAAPTTATQRGLVRRGPATPLSGSSNDSKCSVKPRGFPVGPNSAFTPVDPLANLYTIAEACLLNNINPATPSSSSSSSSSTTTSQSFRANLELSVASEVTVADNSGLQIFTTINEPYTETHEALGSSREVVVTAGNQQTQSSTLCVSQSLVAGEVCGMEEEEEQYVVQGSSSCGETASNEVEPSIYQLLFQLPSAPNSTLCTAVRESMQMALKHTADPCQLAQVAGQSLTSVFDLYPSTYLAVVCPSRCAAYLTSLSSILTHQGLLNPSLTRQTTSAPPIVLHDAVCETGSPSVFSSLLGACNWNLGTHTVPMDRELLQSTVSTNRVTAVLYRPFVYPASTSNLSLREIHSICHPQSVPIIVDCTCSAVASNTLCHLKATVNEMLTTGADLIMLPNTEHFQGPPHTCVLVGRTDLLAGYWEQLSQLQTSLPLPLFCTAYDTVGSVVAFKSLQVSGLKTEPMN